MRGHAGVQEKGRLATPMDENRLAQLAAEPGG